MIDKFKKASNDRLIGWIKKAGEILKERGVDIRIYQLIIMDEMITISQKEYNQLKKDSDWLYYLERAGVDNWDGFDYALELKERDEDFGTN